MYVCICKAVTDKQIKAAQAEGHLSFEEIKAELGVASCCGRCESLAKEVLAESQVGHYIPSPSALQGELVPA